MSEQGDMLGLPEDPESLIDKDLGGVPESKWAPMLANILSVLEVTYQRKGMDPASAFSLASASTVALADYLGGRSAYIPRGDRLKLALRDAEIYRRARGGNIEQLAVEFKLTTITIYKIIKDQGRLYRAKVQWPLSFPTGE